MKKKKMIALGVSVSLVAAGMVATANAQQQKRTLKNNMTEVYNILPKPVDSLVEAFPKGMVYGRLRANFFTYHWDDEITGKQKNNYANGIGGSLIYKTAPFKGFSATVGLYTSQNPFNDLNMDKIDVKYAKSGKDTFDRHRIKDNGAYDGDWGMTSLAQAYLQYDIGKTEFKVGRQIYESFLTKSNDTKMIPNTFQGVSVIVRDLPGTMFTAAYFNRQKLRDHTGFHDVIAYDGWNENDDSAINKGLTTARLEAHGIDDTKLIVVGLANKSIRNLKVDAWLTSVPDLFWSGMVEANYTIHLAGGWSVTPGLRYMDQLDTGAGKIGGAALNGSLAGLSGSAKGYDDAGSVDGSLVGGRLVIKKGNGKLRVGYTAVADDADLIAPWRGFPTSGYTRSMGQYNWDANTKSWMIAAAYDFDKAGIIPGFRTAVDYTVMDYDETKELLGGISKTDREAYHIDMWERINAVPGLEVKVRFSRINADNRLSNGTDPSYYEARFEMNYLF